MNIVSGFSRLKGIFSSSVNLGTYDSILSSARNAECGNVPQDIINILLSKGSAKNTLKSEIDAIKSAFAETSDILSQGISVNQRAQKIQLHRELGEFFDKKKIISLDFLRDANYKSSLMERTACTRGIDRAQKSLTESLASIIPNCAKVEIKPLGIGAYGQGYKLEFLDASGNKLIHDKVIKVFYEEGQTQFDLLTQIMPMVTEKFKEISSQFTLRDIVTMWNNIKSITVEDVMKFMKPMEEQIAKEGFSLQPEKIEKALLKLQSVKLKDIKPFFEFMKSEQSDKYSMGMDMFKNMQEKMSHLHGVCAEANTMMFLRNRVGHSLRKTNVVAPDYYNLKKGFSIAEFSDDLLPVSKSDVDFRLLGLEHQDLHRANKVSGKIIDIGGVSLRTPELTDKITARYYKKIMNQKNPELRQQYIEQLKKEMELMNQLDKEKVQKAIDLAA